MQDSARDRFLNNFELTNWVRRVADRLERI
jgi:hypothetical protein